MKETYGKNVFITGVSSGIGKYTAIAFAKQGYYVTGVSRHCKEGIRRYKSGGYIRFVQMDVTDEERVRYVLSKVDEVNVLVLSAGCGIGGAVAEVPTELLRKQMDVNYFGAASVIREVIPKMHAQGGGLIVAIGSLAGRVSIPMQSAYSASKYALEALIEALRIEERDYGVKATIVDLGDTKTGFTDAREVYVEEGSCYQEDVEHAIGVMEHDEMNGQSPIKAAKAIFRLSTMSNPPHRITVGKVNKAFMTAIKHLPDKTIENLVTKMYME
ncbi:MAG: SDR family NAD(P)-dependent oxidoreductase [Lachnospiraceae bacterium]|nr:SDR family NAD(P)-dependent oxidoreductase [Lachnospiraceae bacterium]